MDQITTYQPEQLPATHEVMPVPAGNNVVATTTQQTPTDTWTVKEKLVYGLLGLVSVGGTIWLGKKIYLNIRSNKEENKSFEDGSSATVAKQIKMAFENDGWWGTNTTALRQTLVSVQSQEDWDKVLKSYERLYSTPTEKANLLKDLSDELQSTEYNEMLQIINVKPKKRGQAPTGNQYQAWAKRFKSAFDKEYGVFPGTDDEAMTAILNELPTQAAFIKTGVEYKKLYGTNILEDMNAESEFGQYDEWMAILVKKRKQ
ncbi:MAG: hypothetical protein HY062_01695 [Bacteroidetes bacterium]|nr:hypothetical protein [Bacteroidota bacterium]